MCISQSQFEFLQSKENCRSFGIFNSIKLMIMIFDIITIYIYILTCGYIYLHRPEMKLFVQSEMPVFFGHPQFFALPPL